MIREINATHKAVTVTALSHNITGQAGNMTANPVVSLAQVLLTYPQCEKQKDELLEWLKQQPGYECSVVSHEKHHETEGDHLHAWLKLIKCRKVRSDTLQKMFDWEGYHPNVELVKNKKADKERVVRYVIKDGDYIADNCDIDKLTGREKGRKYNTRQILETDIETLVDNEVITVRDYRAVRWAQRDWALRKSAGYTLNCKGLWLWGDAGTGKTKFCEQFGLALGGYYEKACNKWWDGYDGQEVVIMDEIRNNALLEAGYLFKWADNSPCKIEMKGSTAWSRHRYLLVTSNIDPMDLCRDKDGYLKPDLWEPLQRRFKFVEVRKDKLPKDSPYVKFCKESIWDNPNCTLEEVLAGHLMEHVPLEAAEEPPAPKHAPPTEDTPSDIPTFPGEADFQH